MRQIDFKTQAGTKDKEEHNDKAGSPKRKYNVHKYLLTQHRGIQKYQGSIN